MKRRPTRNSLTAFTLGAALLAAASVPAHAAEGGAFPDILQRTLNAACKGPYDDPAGLRAAVEDGRLIRHSVTDMGGAPGRSETVILTPDGQQIEATRLFPGGTLRRVQATLTNGRPLASLSADNQCRITEARKIDYGADGHAETIRIFAPDLGTVSGEIPLNPDVPPGTDPGGVRVGLIDSGVAYTVAPFSDHLARSADGTLIGRDLWDGDARPFDIDTGRSPFFPLHHGSAVMSVLIREAPAASIVPVRYPRPDMQRMADAVNFFAEHGVVIVNMAMGSNDIADWQTFAAAARAQPQMLFIISAGNDGRDIDRSPVYPAALGLANSIVVTSSELDGRLAQGSNWGATSVDLMVPGERVPVIDHRGAPGKASGSSFAVPRVSALAARLLAAHPTWRGPELRDAILKRGRPLAGPKQTRYGWIPDPTDGP